MMSLWLRRAGGLDTAAMREMADVAGVSWSADTIKYRGNGIGYADGDEADATAIRVAAESVIGFRPVVIDAPPEPNDQP